MKLDTKIGNMNLEQGLMAFALVTLAGAGLYKAFTYGDTAKSVAGRTPPPPTLAKVADYQDIATGIKETPVWAARDHNLFIPRLIAFYPSDSSIKVLDWNVPMEDGLTPKWKQQYDFPIDDPTVAGSDPDQDGYSNKEEFDSNTDPREKSSSPPVIKKLFVKNYNPKNLQIVFKAYNPLSDQPGVLEYQINTPGLTRRSWRLKEGDVIKVDEFNKYVIGKFREKVVERVNPKTGILEKVDISELDVFDPRLNETLTLVMNTQQNSDQSSVEFELLVPGESPTPPEVNIGQKFKVRDKEYQLRRFENDRATILDISANKEISIGKPGAPAPAPAPEGAPAAGTAPAAASGTPAPAPAAPAPAVP